MLKIKGTILATLSWITAGLCQEPGSVVSPNFIFETLALNRDVPTAAWPKYTSPTDLVPSPDKKKLYIAEQTAKQIAVFDVESRKIEKKIKLPNEVTGLAVSSDGTLIYATCSSELWPDGFVCEVNIASGKVNKRIAVGHGARSPNIGLNGKILTVCNQYDDNVSIVDLASGKEKKTIDLIREPYASKITPDGKTLVVANSLPNDKATDSLSITNKVQLIGLESEKITATIDLTVGSHSSFGLEISPDGKYAFVTHLIGMFNREATQVEGGWIHTNNVAIIDIEEKKMVNDVTFDFYSSGAANPWGMAASSDGKYMATVMSGSNELYVFELEDLITLAVENAKNKKSLSNVFSSFSVDITHKRIIAAGLAPRAVTIIDDKIYTTGYFSDTLDIYNLNTKTTAAERKPVARIEINPPQKMTAHRMGEYRFFDASLCTQKWQSCHSCHPFGRADGLNWILNASQKLPKNAKSMLYSWWTPRTSWAGKRDDARSSVRAGIKEELFQQSVDEKLAVSIDSFLVRMKPIPSPVLVKGRLSSAAQRGKEIYYNKSKTNCITCHPAPLFTNLQFYDAGFVDQFDANTQWDTPGLNECWRNAPYDHLGSSLTLEDCLRSKGHANISKLSDSDIKDLFEYVLSL